MFGSDPEFVIKRPTGEVISAPKAMQLIPKLEKVRLPKIKTRYGLVFPDNANLEMSINPGSTKQEVIDITTNLFKITKNMLSDAEEGMSIHTIPALEYSKEQLDHPICKVFGCEPDFNIFNNSRNVIPEGAAESPFRTCGGHVHISPSGSKESNFFDTFEGVQSVGKHFELLIGASAVGFLDKTPEAALRKNLYGKAGAHRLKPYGIECRSQSNYWYKHPKLVEYMFDSVEIVKKMAMEQEYKTDWNALEHSLNANNEVYCNNLVVDILEYYPEYATILDSAEMFSTDKKLGTNVFENWKI